MYFTLCLDSISLQLNSYSSDSRSSADHLNRPRSKQSECWIDPEDKFKVLKSKHLRISLCFSSRSCSLTNCKDPPHSPYHPSGCHGNNAQHHTSVRHVVLLRRDINLSQLFFFKNNVTLFFVAGAPRFRSCSIICYIV